MQRPQSLTIGLALALGLVVGARGEEPEAAAPTTLEARPDLDLFKAPTTPEEYWAYVHELIATGKPGEAVGYLKGFLASKPDDDALMRIRDQYGLRSVLQIGQHPETRPYEEQVRKLFDVAERHKAVEPDAIARAIQSLTGSREEQLVGVDRLRKAGPAAVPYVLEALRGPGRSAEDRRLIAANLGLLDASAIDPLVAALRSPDAALVVDVIDALTRIGGLRAVPQLTYLAASPTAPPPVRDAARLAVEALTGRSFESQRLSPVRLLTAEALRYHRHEVRFPFQPGPVTLWEWSAETNAPAAREVTPSQAEEFFGLMYAREALDLNPADRPAQVAALSLALEKAIERVGFAAFPAQDPSGVFASALAAGPAVLTDVIRQALADRKFDLAAVAVTAFGLVADTNALATDRRPNPLVEALSAPNRRVQFAAARALVRLNPRARFAGSSRVVPVLAWFTTNQPSPRAVVIDGNPVRGSQLAGYLKALGYEPELTPTGDEGFRAAAERADVELVLIDHHLIQGAWRVVDTVSNLQADARTAGLPIYIVGPLYLEERLAALKANYPMVRFVVQPTSAAVLEQQIGGRPSALSGPEREAYARAAAALLAQVAQTPGSPFEPDLRRVEPALTIALNTPGTSLAASVALGDVADTDGQRSLADAALDPARPPDVRLSAAVQLARNIQRFGPLVSADQEVKLVAAADRERQAALRSALAAAVGALRPRPALTGLRLRQYAPAPGPPAPPVPAPASAPSPPTGEPAPPEAQP